MDGKIRSPEEARERFQKCLASVLDVPLKALTSGENPAETFGKLKKCILRWRLWHHLSVEEMAALMNLPKRSILALEHPEENIDPLILCYLQKRLHLEEETEEEDIHPTESCERFLRLLEPSLFQKTSHPRYISARAVLSVHVDREYGIFLHATGFTDPFVIPCPIRLQEETADQIIAWLAGIWEEDRRILDVEKLIEERSKKKRPPAKKEG